VADYYNDTMISRQRLLWTIATRRQLERWEPFVAQAVLGSFEKRRPDGADVWAAEIEHHFVLIAGRNLLHALDLPPRTSVTIDKTLHDELIEGRDLHEHWRENLPLFNVTPRPGQPRYRSGKRFAARNPDVGPYDWLAWGNKTGARLLPNVSAPALHEVLDAVENEVLAKDAGLRRFIPPRAPSPWIHQDGEWWPLAAAES
jgi:hypothetical protein